jgi:hypothetical protein
MISIILMIDDDVILLRCYDAMNTAGHGKFASSVLAFLLSLAVFDYPQERRDI